MDFLSIDGTIGEGGGSITRLSAGFAVLFNQSIHLQNIRANRNPPGLRLQHQLGFEALQDLTDGQLSSIKVGTTDLKFSPGNARKTRLHIHIRTAGSIALLSQTIQTAFIQTNQGNPLEITYSGGGTFGMGAPDPYYLNAVTYSLFSEMGYRCFIDVERNGYYPKGGAAAKLNIHPVKDVSSIHPLILDTRGELLEIGGIIVCSDNLAKPKVAERINKSFISSIRKDSRFVNIPKEIITIKKKYEKTSNPGVGLSIWAKYENTILGTGTILGKRGLPSEIVGKNAAARFIKQLSNTATIDSYAADQIVPLLVLCPYRSRIRIPEITSHLNTNIELLQHFQKRKYSIKKDGDSWLLEYEPLNY